MVEKTLQNYEKTAKQPQQIGNNFLITYKTNEY